MKRLLVLVGLGITYAAVGLALTTAEASAQAPPPTLTGETLLAGTFAPAGTSSVIVTSANCNPEGISTFTYFATGPAGPPYVGTFTETGTVTIDAQIFGVPPQATGPVTSWTATFTIMSAIGLVEGNKELPPPPPGTISNVAGACTSGATPEFRSAATGFGSSLTYAATITTPDGGQFSDRGLSNASVNVYPDLPVLNNFFEQYTSQQTATTPLCNGDDDEDDDEGDDDDDDDDEGDDDDDDDDDEVGCDDD